MALRADNITKCFGDNKVIDSFTHEFAESCTTVIMGASGCGKSTLLSMLMGVLAPDSGTVTGNQVRTGAVFQEDRLCENLSVQSNLRLVVPGRKRSFDTELEAVGLGGCALRDFPRHPAQHLHSQQHAPTAHCPAPRSGL